MSVITKIHELKDSVAAQNEMIKTLRQEKQEFRSSLAVVYSSATKYRSKLLTQKTAAETEKYVPEMSSEDMSRLSSTAVLEKLGKAFAALSVGLEETRAEVHGIHKEIGGEVDAALEEWRILRSSEDTARKQKAFRDGLYEQATPDRSATPDIISVPVVAPDTPPVDPVTPVTSSDKKTKGKKLPSQPKSGTGTLEDYLNENPTSPTTGAKKSKKSDAKK